jgi:ATP-dependent Clp protease protease subunit
MDLLHLVGPFCPEMAGFFFPAFAEADNKKGKEPILIRMTSPGGDATIGLAMYDLVRTARHPVVIEAYGEASSIAIVFLQSAGRRRVSQSLRGLIHNGSMDMSEGLLPGKHLSSVAKELKRLDGFMHRLLVRHSGRSLKEIQKLCLDEAVMTAQEFVNVGFADDIIGLPKEK